MGSLALGHTLNSLALKGKKLWLEGHFKNAYELLNLRALKFSLSKKYIYPLKFHTSILPIHWKMCYLLRSENLKATRFYKFVSVFEMPPIGHWGLNKMADIWQKIFSSHFLERSFWYFDSNLNEDCFWLSNLTTGSGNTLLLNSM